MGRSVKRSDLQTGWHSSSRHPFYCDSGLVRWRTFLRRRAAAVFLFVEFLLNLQFPLLIRISASSAIGNGKLVVASGIGWHHLHIALQWRDRVLRAHGGNKCHSQSEIGFGKAWVQLVSFCEMWNGIVPLTVAACKLPKPEFRGSVQRIDGELKFELLLCILGVLRRIGPRYGHTSKPVMHPRHLGIVREDLLVNQFGAIPIALGFKRLCFQLERLIGCG